jgi:hypothetical protein
MARLHWAGLVMFGAGWMLAGCFAPADLPPRKAAIDGPAPRLLPLSELRAMQDGGADMDAITAQTLARANALQARAARLRGPVIPTTERAALVGSAVAQR